MYHTACFVLRYWLLPRACYRKRTEEIKFWQLGYGLPVSMVTGRPLSIALPLCYIFIFFFYFHWCRLFRAQVVRGKDGRDVCICQRAVKLCVLILLSWIACKRTSAETDWFLWQVESLESSSSLLFAVAVVPEVCHMSHESVLSGWRIGCQNKINDLKLPTHLSFKKRWCSFNRRCYEL